MRVPGPHGPFLPGERPGVVTWQRVTDEVAAAVRPSGFDVVHSFRAAWYDEAVAPAERLPWAAGGSALAILIGNTRSLWPLFRAAMEADPTRHTVEDPLDCWVEQQLRVALAAAFGPGAPRHLLVFAHEPPPRRLPFQRLALHAGLAPISPGRLLAHPDYGPWFALRAVLVVDVEGPLGPPPSVGAPCEDCEAPCLAAFEAASAVPGASDDLALFRRHWRAWLAVRDACPVGREHRYPDDQIRFHYAREWSAA